MQAGDRDAIGLWSQLQLKIPQYFRDVQVEPSLLHGDLWGGNAAEISTGPGKLCYQSGRKCLLCQYQIFIICFVVQLFLILHHFMATMNMSLQLLECLVASQLHFMKHTIRTSLAPMVLIAGTNYTSSFII